MVALSGPWPVRLAWAILPVTVGPALGEALADRSGAVARTGSVLAWAVWAGGLLAVALPRTVSLTVLRILAPLAAVVGVWATLAGARAGSDVLAAGASALVLVTAFAPQTGDAFADGSSYGSERRMLLRPPAALLLGPVQLAWAATVAGPVLGSLLLAAEQWVAGAVVLAGGIPAAVGGGRALHGLSRRWVVFVPNGLVLHDLLAMADPVLFPRRTIARLGAATAAGANAGPDDATDLTNGAGGLALQLDLVEPLSIAPRRGRRALDVTEVVGVRFAPSRPGALLEEAAARRIPVG